MKNKRVLITGGTGYIGQILHDFLGRYLTFSPRIISIGSEFDISDKTVIDKFIKAVRPHQIYHLAAKAETDWCEQNPKRTYEVNVKGTYNVVKAGLEVGSKIVNFSTACLYPDNNKYYKETDKPDPRCVYTDSKARAEAKLKQEGLYDAVLTIRARQPFSNHRHDRNLIQKLSAYPVHTKCPNSMTHVEELIPIVTYMARKEYMGCYNITNPGVTSPWKMEYRRRIIEDNDYDKPEQATHEFANRNSDAVRVNSLVNCDKLLHDTGIELAPVSEAIIDCVRNPVSLGKYDWSKPIELYSKSK